MNTTSSPLVFLSFETAFAPFGGLASVLPHMVGHVGYHLQQEVYVFTPFHRRSPKMTSVPTVLVGSVTIPVDGSPLTIQIHRFDEKLSINGQNVTVHWHFLKPESELPFNGKDHLYDLGETEEEINRNLRRDSLLFGAGSASALQYLFPSGRVTVFMQDWSALTTALFLPRLDRWVLKACIHNGYDSAVSEADLLRFGITAPSDNSGTVLAQALRRIAGPIMTVSQQFSFDLREDIFQAQVFTPHLQDIFAAKGIIGIDHGPFVGLKFPPDLAAKTLRGIIKPIAAWKAEAKKKALALVAELQDSATKPVWGDPVKFVASPLEPWLLSGGRADFRQKGFDALAKAISLIIESGEKQGKWLLMPMAGIEGKAGLLFLKKLAKRYPDRVLVLPFIWKEGFATVSTAAAFGLVTSYFEPGGLGSEFVANATPMICSATGGSIMQCIPWRASATMHQGVQAKCNRWHGMNAAPSGIVYDARDHTLPGWQSINAAGYVVGGEPDVVQHRSNIPLFQDLARELALAMKESLRLFHDNPASYYQMAANGAHHFERNFSWVKAGAEYSRQLAN